MCRLTYVRETPRDERSFDGHSSDPSGPSSRKIKRFHAMAFEGLTSNQLKSVTLSEVDFYDKTLAAPPTTGRSGSTIATSISETGSHQTAPTAM